MHPIATTVKSPAQIREVASEPKFSRPIERPPRMTVKLSQDRKVRSFAKKTLGSTRVGRAMRFPGAVWSRGWDDIMKVYWRGAWIGEGTSPKSWGEVKRGGGGPAGGGGGGGVALGHGSSSGVEAGGIVLH